jgi:hypothetical protein
MVLCRSIDALVVRAAMIALEQIGDPSSAATAQAMLFVGDLMTRKAAMRHLAQFPEQAMPVADAHIKSPDEFRTRIAIELLGLVGTPQALEKIGALLLDPRPGVRIECLLRLAGRCPDNFRADFLSLRNDPISAVKSVAQTVEPS